MWWCSNKDVQLWCSGESSSEDEAAYDEDDENAENNWRNDYPDDDPMYFERLHLDDYYSSDDDGEYYFIWWILGAVGYLLSIKFTFTLGTCEASRFDSDGLIRKFRIAAPATFAVVP